MPQPPKTVADAACITYKQQGACEDRCSLCFYIRLIGRPQHDPCAAHQLFYEYKLASAIVFSTRSFHVATVSYEGVHASRVGVIPSGTNAGAFKAGDSRLRADGDAEFGSGADLSQFQVPGCIRCGGVLKVREEKGCKCCLLQRRSEASGLSVICTTWIRSCLHGGFMSH